MNASRRLSDRPDRNQTRAVTVRQATDNRDDAALFEPVVRRNAYGSNVEFIATDALPGGDRPQRDEWWLQTGLQAVRERARRPGEFTAFDVADEYQLPEPSSPAQWGCLMTEAKRQGVVMPVGYARSRRPDAHGALCRTWRGAR